MLEKEVWTSRWESYDKASGTWIKQERRCFCWTVEGSGVAGIEAHCPLPEVDDWLFDGDHAQHPSLGMGTGMYMRSGRPWRRSPRPTLSKV